MLKKGKQCGIIRPCMVLNCVHKSKIKIRTVKLFTLLFLGLGKKYQLGLKRSNLRKQVLPSGKSLITGGLRGGGNRV